MKISLIQDLFPRQPLVVYTPGKVGSSTVHHTLLEMRLRHYQVYHTHFLTPGTIDERRELFVSLDRKVPKHLRSGMEVSKMLADNKIRRWKLITLTRDHFSRTLSDFFQQLEVFPDRFRDLTDESGVPDAERITGFLRQKLVGFDPAEDYLVNWYEKELKAVFGIDIYSIHFSRQKGFAILHDEKADLLFMRMEDLNEHFPEALREFLSLRKPVEMMQSNITGQKKKAGIYQQVRQQLEPPPEYLAKLHATEYYRHFYQ